MRKVTFGCANSLDNYIARKDDSVDWLMWSKETTQMMKEFWKTIDTILMGRKTYEVGLRLSKGKINTYPGMKYYVFSHTIKESSDESIQIISTDVAEFVLNLKKQKGKDICVMGGGLLAKTLLEANLIDELSFCIHPVLLGSGIPLFYEMKRQTNLDLIDCKTFKNGCVVVTYRVKQAKPQRKSRK